MVYPIGYYVGMRGMTPRADCANVAPAPHLSFSCVKKKDGGERKSLMQPFRRAWGDTPHWKNVAAPRSSSPHRGNKTLLKPLCRCGLRPFIKGIETFKACVAASTPASCRGSSVLASYQPRLVPVSPHAPKSRATNSPGDALHGEKKETRVDALPLPVSSA